ncbi:MAG: nitrous oxide reductase family maturation protein NosD [Candidatus Thorarchaeota archaeon]
MNHRILMLVFVFILALVIATPATYSDEAEGKAHSSKKNLYLSNEIHSPIQILNDSQLVNLAEDENWEGDGSESTPFIIDAYNITSDLAIGIEIRNVSIHFMIRNCHLDSASGIFEAGILLHNVSHSVVLGTTVHGKTTGIYVDDFSKATIIDCTIYGCSVEAIRVDQAESCKIQDSHVYWSSTGIFVSFSNSVIISDTDVYTNYLEGIYFISSNFGRVTGSTVYDNDGAGVYFYKSHNCSVIGNSIYGNADITTGIHFLDSDNATVSGNEIHDNQFAGLMLDNSKYAMVQDNQIWYNGDNGIRTHLANNCTIKGNDIYENGYWPVYFDKGGILIDNTIYSSIEGNRIWNNSYAGIYLVNTADLNDIVGNLIFNNTDHGIYGYDSDSISVVGNDIWGNGWNPTEPTCGIFVYDCINWWVEDNEIWNNTMDGIHFGGAVGSSGVVLKNEVYDNAGDGIHLINAGPFLIDENIIHDNAYGIYVNLDDYANVTSNIVYDNSIGVFLQSGGTWVYGNDIGWNALENAADVAGVGANHWHDTVSMGNWWSDYSGVGDYIITAFVGPGAYDIFPKKSLDLNASLPLAFEIMETGNTMFWEAYALNPSHYEVYVNDILSYREGWDGGQIETNLDGTAAGDYEIMVIAYHTSGHSTNESSTAEVSDLTPPEWESTPQDQEITEGRILSYQLRADDPSGIGGFALNDSVHFSIDSSGLISNSTYLAAGTYVLNVTVWDTFGNTRFAIIAITVLPAPPTGDGTDILLFAAVGGGAAVLLGLAIIALKKKE